MYQFTLDSVKRMGDPHEKYGSSYWCTSAESDLPIKFNSMNPDLEDLLESGPFSIVAEEKSSKISKVYTDEEGNQKGGNEYLQLRKVKLVESNQVAKPASQIAGSHATPSGHLTQVAADTGPALKLPSAAQDTLDRIEQQLQEIDSKLDRLLGTDTVYDPDEVDNE